MAPMAWPFLAMAVLFIGASFSGRLRARAVRIVFAGACASLLFELALSAFPGNNAIYSFWLGTDLQKRIFVDFELDVLAFVLIPLDLLLVFFSCMYLWTRQPGAARAVTSPDIAPAIPAEKPPVAWVREPQSQAAAPTPKSPAPKVGALPQAPSVQGPPAGPSPIPTEGAFPLATEPLDLQAGPAEPVARQPDPTPQFTP
jgi:hypothetical protein